MIGLTQFFRRHRLPLLICGATAALDWVSKAAAERFLVHAVPLPIAGDFVRLTLSFNPGSALGIRLGGVGVHTLLTFAVIAMVVVLALRTPVTRRLENAGYGLVLGGAVGNVGDRLTQGYVTDFLDIGFGNLRWWTFNVADIALAAGVVLLLVASRKIDDPAEGRHS